MSNALKGYDVRIEGRGYLRMCSNILSSLVDRPPQILYLDMFK